MRIIYGALAVLLVACGGGQGPDGQPDGEQVAEKPGADAPTEGAADEPVEYPDGMTVQLATVESFPDRAEEGVTAVRVTVAMTNGGDSPVDLDSPMQRMQLLHGPNRQEASRAVRMMDDGFDWDSDDPRQAGAGETVETFHTFEVPDGDLDKLAVKFTPHPGEIPAHTFTDVQGRL